LPFAASVFSNYRGTEGLTWKKDRGGVGGILTLSPYFDGGELDDYWQFDECLDATVELRNRLLAGDLRALYVMWICAAFSEGAELSEVIEPPVPGGLPELVEPYSALLEFFGLDPLLLLAASEGAPASPEVQTQDRRFLLWVQGLTDLEAKQLLRKFLAEDATAVQAETIAAIRQAGDSPQWPAASLGRSLEQLQDRTELLRAEHAAKEREKCEAAAKRAAAERERQRLDRMKEMVKQPQRWLREAERLVKARGTANYQAAAAILADLRETVGGDQGNKLSCQHAEQLATKHPTLTMLKSTLRKQGLLK
jgi:hypothetical protein